MATDAPPRLSWDQVKALQPSGPVPVNPERPNRVRAPRPDGCRHTRKHHTAAGECRKCRRHAATV
jgi:hypothetical protein